MAHEALAEAAVIVGAVGCAAALLARNRVVLVTGFVLLAVAELGLLHALVPDFYSSLGSSPLRIAAAVAGTAVVVFAAVPLVRYATAVPVVLLVAAPFRVPAHLAGQEAFLLPLYGALGAASLALLVRALRGDEVRPVTPLLALPAVAYVALAAVSLFWSKDVHAGTVEIFFFLLPFAALVAVLGRMPIAPWLPRALATAIVALAALFAVIGLWQERAHHLFFGKDIQVGNAYTSYYRVTSLFKDPSLYGRQLVLAIAVVLVALWLDRLRLVVALPVLVLLWAGLYVSYSQSSMVALIVVALAVSLVAADSRSRRLLLVGTAAFVLAAGGVVAASVQGSTTQRITSQRSRLVGVTWPIFVDHTLTGVGIGAQPKVSRHEVGGRRQAKLNASHTTPLTVAAELGVIGLAAYLAFLGGAARTLYLAYRRERALGLGLAAVFLVLVVHSLFYAGFWEDPYTWGAPALAAAAIAWLAAPARERGLSALTAAPARR